MRVLIVALVIPSALLGYIAYDVFTTLVPAILVLVMLALGFLYAWGKKFTKAQFESLQINE